MKKSSEKLELMGRRRFLLTLANLGAVGAAAAGITAEEVAALTDDPSSEIPQIVRWRHTNHDSVSVGNSPPIREPVYETIPRDDYVRLQGAIRASETLQKQHHAGLGYGITRRRVSGAGANVLVEHVTTRHANGEVSRPAITAEEAREQIPESIVETVHVGGKKHTVTKEVVFNETVRSEDNYFDTDYRPVPGGCEVSLDSKTAYSTNASPCYSNRHGSYGWVTASHVVNRETGTELDQANYGSTIGTTKDATELNNGDVAFVDDSGDGTITYDMASYDGQYEGWEIMGSVSQSGCENAVYYGDPVYGQGATTGRTKGSALDLSNNGHGDVLTSDAELTGGDSGGPHFEKNPDGSDPDDSEEISLYAIHKTSPDVDDDGADEMIGNTAYWAEEKLNFTV